MIGLDQEDDPRGNVRKSHYSLKFGGMMQCTMKRMTIWNGHTSKCLLFLISASRGCCRSLNVLLFLLTEPYSWGSNWQNHCLNQCWPSSVFNDIGVCVCIGSLSIYIGKQYTGIMQLSFNATFNLAQGSRNLGETPSWPCALIPKELKSMKMRYSSVWTSRRFSFCSALVKSGTPWRPVKLVSINHYTGSVMKTFHCVQQNSSNEVL